MIFGVAYHVIPRFTGNPLQSRRLATVHWWMANAGLAVLVAGFVARVHAPTSAIPVLAAGGILAATGAYLFIYNLWRTIDGRPAPRPAARYSTPPPSRRSAARTGRSRNPPRARDRPGAMPLPARTDVQAFTKGVMAGTQITRAGLALGLAGSLHDLVAIEIGSRDIVRSAIRLRAVLVDILEINDLVHRKLRPE